MDCAKKVCSGVLFFHYIVYSYRFIIRPFEKQGATICWHKSWCRMSLLVCLNTHSHKINLHLNISQGWISFLAPGLLTSQSAKTRKNFLVGWILQINSKLEATLPIRRILHKTFTKCTRVILYCVWERNCMYLFSMVNCAWARARAFVQVRARFYILLMLCARFVGIQNAKTQELYAQTLLLCATFFHNRGTSASLYR